MSVSKITFTCNCNIRSQFYDENFYFPEITHLNTLKSNVNILYYRFINIRFLNWCPDEVEIMLGAYTHKLYNNEVSMNCCEQQNVNAFLYLSFYKNNKKLVVNEIPNHARIITTYTLTYTPCIEEYDDHQIVKLNCR